MGRKGTISFEIISSVIVRGRVLTAKHKEQSAVRPTNLLLLLLVVHLRAEGRKTTLSLSSACECAVSAL